MVPALQTQIKETEALIHRGRLKDAQPLVIRLLESNPDIAQVKALAGQFMREAGRLPEALNFYHAAFKLRPMDAMMVTAMGAVFLEMNEPQKARACFAQAEQLKPNDPAILVRMGQTFIGEDNRKAQEYFEQALQLLPDMKIAQRQLVISYHKEGRLDALAERLTHYLAKHPKAFGLRYFLCEHYFQMQQWDALHTLTEQTAVMKSIPEHERARLIILEFLAYYLLGKTANLPEYFALANHLHEGLKLNPRLYRNANAFYLYLLRLLQYQRDNALLYQGESAPALHVVGDSHVMGAAGLHIRMADGLRRCQSHLILGAKAFHLQGDTPDSHRSYFEHRLSCLPEASDVLLMLGEIDCRTDEGIVPYALRHGLPVEQVAGKTATAYVRCADIIAKRFRHRLLICTVPAKAPARIVAAQKDGDEEHLKLVPFQLEAIVHFNNALRQTCGELGLGIVDAYQESIGEKGMARPDAHLETIHLAPQTLKAAIEKTGMAVTR